MLSNSLATRLLRQNAGSRSAAPALAIACGFVWFGSAEAATTKELERLLAKKEAELAQKEESVKALRARLNRASHGKASGVDARAPLLRPSLSGAEESVESQRQALRDIENNDDPASRALERTLVQEGASLLAPYQRQITPGIFGSLWDFGQRPTSFRSSWGGRLGLAMGLPWESQIQLSVPFAQTLSAYGTSRGMGEIDLSVSKQLLNESETLPSLVATVGGLVRTGAEDLRPTMPGSRARSGYGGAYGGLSLSKRFDPIVLFGGAYTSSGAALALKGGDVSAPGVAVGGRLGALLALSPQMSLNTAFNFARETGAYRYWNTDYLYWNLYFRTARSWTSNSGTFSLGLSTVLTPSLLLQITATQRIIGPGPDFSLSVALPYYF
jgi:hypothetical protein